MKSKIGLIGFGTIGNYLFHKIEEEGCMEVAFVFEVDRKKTESLNASFLLDSFDEFEKRGVDLVVEAALPQVIKEFGPRILKKSDLLILSLTSLADEAFRRELERTAKEFGKNIYIPHGAILGLDGIHDGRNVIERVEITTIKNPKSLGLKNEGITKPVVVYEGITKEACERFPRNVNVHASVALMGLGFEKTRSKIIADPFTNSMAHMIEVIGKGLRWKIEIESRSAGEVTGVYTPESVYQTLRRIGLEQCGFRLA